ncbi:MAG: glycosyltransferase [Ruminococcaceae bacterium]|nr:glycosyltransferase [Oscillospiraceae bacterium]
MKILMAVASLDIGGAETHICQLATELRKMGEEVTVVSSGGENLRLLCRAGVAHRYIPLNSHSPLKLMSAYFGLLSLVRKERFDIIHAHSRIAAFICERVARKRGLPFVTTVHAAFSLSPIKKYMTRWGYYVSAVSPDLAIYLRENYGVAPERIRIIPNGVDTDRFSPFFEAGGPPRIVFMSRLDSDCSLGAECLIDISSTLAEEYRGVVIDIIGGGSEYASISEEARRKNREIGYECVRLHGAQSSPEKILRGGTVFVGVSRAALEAMSCGLPTILAGNEGFFGIVDEGNYPAASESNFCGRGEKPLSKKILLRDLRRLLDMSDGERWVRGEKLRNLTVRLHGGKRMSKMTLDFYRHAIENLSTHGGEVCLCGYYGYGNLGDDTLLLKNIERARSLGYRKISALTARPSRDRYTFSVECRSRSSLFSVVSAIRKSDLLVFGGGTLIQDRTSLRSLLYYCALSEIARFFSVPMELWANGIGEISSPLGRFFVRRLLSYTRQVGVRDRCSRRISEELSVTPEKIVFERDPAFFCGGVFGLWRKRLLGICGEGYIVVCLKSGGAELEYRELEAKVSEHREKKMIVLSAYPREDRRISTVFCQEYGGIYVESLSGEELVTLLSGASLCISMRLHPLIFSHIAGIPFFGVGDDIKIKAFCEEYGDLENKEKRQDGM